MFKRDNRTLGLLLGLFGPMAGLVVIYFIKFPSYSFRDFFTYFIHDKRLITSIGSLSLLVNAILFTIYINMHKDKTATGIFIVTLAYGLGILLLKILN